MTALEEAVAHALNGVLTSGNHNALSDAVALIHALRDKGYRIEAEAAAPSEAVTGLDVERLARALQWDETLIGRMLPPIEPFYQRAVAIAALYARLAAQPDGDA